jgi:uridine kinase
MKLLCERLLVLPIQKDTGHVVVLAGGAGSGKSYSIRNFTNVSDFSTIIDYDSFKPLIIKSKKLKEDFYNWLIHNNPNHDLIISSPDDIDYELSHDND